jgi:transposase-like protein
MYTREKRVLLRHYLEQGVGKTELARRFGVSRAALSFAASGITQGRAPL